MRRLGWVTAALLFSGCGGADKVTDTNSALLDALSVMAKQLPLQLEQPQGKADTHAVGLLSKDALFSQRLDSRTFFMHDARVGLGRAAGTFAGSDEAMLQQMHSVLDRLTIPRTELASERVVQESTQEATRGPNGERVLGEAKKGARLVLATRQIEGLAVFSSHVKMTLSNAGTIGFLEAHWPVIPQKVIDEAHALAAAVKSGWHAPERPYATVESIEAGIVHSPAVGTMMDVYPAIRVIYAPTDKHIGQKPMLYLDRDGAPVPTPRQLDVVGSAPPAQR
jgi:hypothetical protein